jgi:two-component system cell cycle sensor histidine kinase/response regulator CckA
MQEQLPMPFFDRGYCHGRTLDVGGPMTFDQEFQDLLGEMPAIVVHVDNEKRVTSLNTLAGGYFGKEAVGRSMVEFVVGGSHIPFPDAEENGVFHLDLWHRTDNNRPVLISWTGKSLHTQAGSKQILIGHDITERFRRNEALRNYRTIVENTNDLVLTLDREGRITYGNKAFASLWGRKRGSFVGRRLAELIEGDDHLSALDELLRGDARGRQRIHGLEARAKGEDDQTIFLEVTASRIYVQGKVVGATVIARNVTQWKRSEELREESEEKFRKLVESSPDGIVITQQERIVYVNPAVDKIMSGGHIRKSLLGVPLKQLLTPDSQHILDRLQKQAFQNKGIPHKFEATLLDNGSQYKYIDISVIVIPYEGKWSFLFFLRDITQRKTYLQEIQDTKALQEAILEAVDSGIAYTRHGKLVWVNQGFSKITGWQAEELSGKPLYGIGLPDDVSNGWTDAAAIAREIDLQHKNGTAVPVAVSSSPLDPNNLSKGVVYVIADMSEKKKMEKRLFQAQKMEAIGTLTGGIAHDFNNILMGIKGYTELLAYQLGDENPLLEDVKEIDQSADRAADLIHRLLAFGRKLEPQLEPVNINHSLENAFKILSRTLPKNIRIRKRMIEKPWTVQADPGQIEQVLLNLGINARDAMPEGGELVFESANVELTQEQAKTHPGLRPGRYVLISVRDSGVGMSPETAARIFDPFFTTKQPGEGTGLGLAMAYGIVKQHKGNIYAESELGKGASFLIYLPLIEWEANKTQEKKLEFKKGTGHILVLDDEKPVRRVLQRALEQMGYTVSTAADPLEGLEYFSQHHEEIDLIITDYMMPEMDGFKFIESAFRIEPTTKILLISGQRDKVSPDKAIKAGAVGLLLKPFSIRALSQVVAQTLL